MIIKVMLTAIRTSREAYLSFTSKENESNGSKGTLQDPNKGGI